MAKDATLMLRLESEQKQKWEDHVDEFDQYGSLTSLVEQAVEERVAEDRQDWTLRDEIGQVIGMLETINKREERLVELVEEMDEKQPTKVDIDDSLQDIIAAVNTRIERMEDRRNE